MRSQRLTVLLTPEEKTALETKAKGLGVTASDLVRLAVEAYDAEGRDVLLDGLAAILEESVREARAALDAAHQEVALLLAEKAAQRSAA